jgi:glycosyltransferase involved in cell wall biosynthesis
VSAPVLLYLVTEDWYFVSHRLPMACAAQRAGYDVHVATRVDQHGGEIERLGFRLHPLDWRRRSLAPLDVARVVRDVRRIYRGVAPDIVHHVSLEPTIVGSLASLGLPVVVLDALTGMGFAFASRSAKAQALSAVLAPLLRYRCGRRRVAVLVQNPDDRAIIASLGVPQAETFTIHGSGIDTELLLPLPEPVDESQPVTAAYVGRLLVDKGVRTLVAAHALLAERGRPIRLLLAGIADPANRASITPEEIEAWKGREGVVPLGQVADIRDVWRAAHIAVLPSRREGLPKSLLEAAACGRPIVATDVPGCREIARARVNALLVPPDDPEALASALDRLAQDRALRQEFGRAGRHLVEAEFSSVQVGREAVALYDRLLGRHHAALPDAVRSG